MRFFHISDLHIGKRVCGFSMIEDQKFILNQILELAKEHRPDGVLIAGDLYDRQVPSAEAVELTDDFLYRLSALCVPVFVISGNHDSAERVAYGGRMMEQAGIFVSRVFDGTVQRYTMKDGKVLHGTSGGEGDLEEADIYLLPFLRPAQVRRFFPDRVIETTQQAVEAVLGTLQLRRNCANILMMHQFLAGAAVCESEELSVGGSDQIDVSVVQAFDYVALGHLHGPQRVGRDTVRYCGSPLKYSFSEVNHQKSVTLVEIQKNEAKRPDISVLQLPLCPRLDLREIQGPIDRLLMPEVVQSANSEDYLHVTLTDEQEVLDAIGRLRDVYPNIMRLDFAVRQKKGTNQEEIRLEEKTPQELFAEFFVRQNGYEMNEAQQALVKEIWEKGGEEA